MKVPPGYLMGVLHDIELAVVNFNKEFPRLTDADVEWTYEKLLKYNKIRASGKVIEEPTSTSNLKQDLIDEILNHIDIREELGLDEQFINDPQVKHGEHIIPSLPYLYALAFKRLKDSARFWRKKDGKKGYLRYIAIYVK